MSETDLIKRCKRGDRGAFNELVLKFQSPVINMAYSMLSDYSDADDAAQEVFIRVYHGINSFRENSSLTTWIYRITSNVCADMLRKRQRAGETISINAPPDDEGRQTEIKDTAPEPEEKIEQNERQKAVRDAIANLRSEYREVITLCDIEQLSYDETAEILRCPVGTVKSRLNRARNQLRKILIKNKDIF